jgi:hypothetical protein
VRVQVPACESGIVTSLGVRNWLGWALAGFLDHLFAGPLEFVSILVEVLGAVVLAVVVLADDE